MVFRPTKQQQDVIDAFHTGKDVLISAGAGCGKSSTLQMVAESTNKRGLLIAFNRSVADEAARKLAGTTTKALNTHRIAYAWAREDKVGSVVLDKMQSSARVRRDQIARAFNINKFVYGSNNEKFTLETFAMTGLAINTLNNFMKDDSPYVMTSHVPWVPAISAGRDYNSANEIYQELASYLADVAQAMWEDICSPLGSNIRVTHDAYLKLWAMAKPVLPYDFILLDEAQDTNPAVFSVFESQDAQRISVGDACQQLFAWNGSLNIMEQMDAEIKVNLTQSWRFGEAIQDAANVFLERLNADIRLQGNPRVQSDIITGASFDPTKSSAVLVRTNAGAIQEVLESLAANQTTHLIGGGAGLKSMLEAAEKLITGQAVSYSDFIGFKNWDEVRQYVEEDDNALDLKVIVNLVDKHGTKVLLNALEKCTLEEDKAQTVVSTVHKVKGREWDQVRLANDFEVSSFKKKREEAPLTKETLMLYYVAVTRAKTLLDPGFLEKFVGNTGNRTVSTEKIPTAIENSLFINLPDDVQAKLRERFTSKEEAEDFTLHLLEEGLSSSS